LQVAADTPIVLKEIAHKVHYSSTL
jgi:hypothetical protein